MDLNLGGSKKKQHHVRKKYSIITLDLFKPTKKSYPEFDYEKICKEYLKEDESSGEDERFHDREAEELVKRLEQKYGGKRDKRGRKIRFGCADDYMDKTAGYDLTDPFIDDTEAYDEHVPSALDTARGGFYVNRGKLEFKSKYAEDDEDSDIEEAVVKKKTMEKKRKISSDEEATDSKRTFVVPSVDNSSSLMESVEGSNSPTVRLSSSGAAPTAKPSDTPRNRLLTQQFIKKRRLLGQPPMAKIQSPAMKAALGVKKKLKPQAKRATVGMTDEDLAGFLNDMAGGEIEPVVGMENVIPVAKEQICPKAANTSIEHETEVDKLVTPPTEKVQQPQVASSSSLVAPSSTAVIPKRSPGRPPGSTIQHKQLPVMSEKLEAMIAIYKQRTKEFGAPNKKIRLPPSLVELCIRIEEQCTLEYFNHQQKTRIFDLLANWVCVQRNSLYIRMKAHRDRHEPNATSDSDINADEPMNETKEAPRSVNDDKLSGSNDSSSTVTVSSSPIISDSSPKSPSETLALEKKEQLIGVKNTTSSDAARSSDAKHPSATTKEGCEKMGTMPTTSDTFSSNSVIKNQNSVVSSKTSIAPSNSDINADEPMNETKEACSPVKAVSSKPPLITNVTKLNNPQLLSAFATIMQQTRGDSIRQQQRSVDSLTAQINANLLNTKQSELFSQYQLTLNNLAKMNTVTATSSMKSAPPKSITVKNDPQPSKPEPKSNRPLSTNSSNPSPIKGLKQTSNEKASLTLKEINSALSQVVLEVEKAIIHTENEYVKEKAKTEKESKIAPLKRFMWTDSLRAALKKQVTLLFTNLEQHGDSANIVNTTVVQYLYYTVRPLFKDYIKFGDLVLEILRLCPERRQLVLIPEMKAFIEISDASKTQSRTPQTSKALKSKTDTLPTKISPNKNISNAELRQTSSNAIDFRLSNTLDRKENHSIKCNSGAEVEIVAGSSRSSLLSTPKLTSGQKIILARDNNEREKLLVEKVVAEKTLKEREEVERKLKEQREREATENRKRDEEAIKKWEREEAERLEASRDENEELGAVESEDFFLRPKDSDLQEIEEVELGADTEIDMNTEEDVNVDQKSSIQMCNSESEQTYSSTEAEKPVVKKTESYSNGLSEQSSPQDSATTSNIQLASSSSTYFHSSSMSQSTNSQSSRQTNVVHFTPSSSYKQPSLVTVTPSKKSPSSSICATTSNTSLNRFSSMHQRLNSSQQQSAPFEQAMQESISVANQDPQVSSSNYYSSCIKQQSPWSAKKLPVSLPSSISNDHQQPTSHSTSSHSSTSVYASGVFATSQSLNQQKPAFSPYSAQQRQISYKNLQSQHMPTIRHASQISQQSIQEQVHQHVSIQHPYNYPTSSYSSTTTTVQKATLPTCNISHNTSRVYSSVLSPQKVMFSQHSVSSPGCSSAFSPLQSPTRQHQLITQQQSAYNYQHQQFLLQHQQQQQQQQQQKQLYGEQQHQMRASQDHHMYSNNWR